MDKIKIESIEVNKEITQLLLESSKKLGEKNQVYLLSFHDDGVIWGKVKDGDLLTSDFSGSPSPEFRQETLQELRLFGENGQLHIWRVFENQFQASLALDDETGKYDFLQSEEQVLYGTDFDDGNQDFTIVRDGSQGLRHAFPQPIQSNKFDGKKRPLRLQVKHYIEYDIEDGSARIAFSRLVKVFVKGV